MTGSTAPFKTDIPQRAFILFGKPDRAVLVSVQPHPKPKLLDQLREAMKSRHYGHRTVETYCHWVKRFIFSTDEYDEMRDGVITIMTNLKHTN
jgi:hypothetical protein